jgi:hypothetical protein
MGILSHKSGLSHDLINMNALPSNQLLEINPYRSEQPCHNQSPNSHRISITDSGTATDATKSYPINDYVVYSILIQGPSHVATNYAFLNANYEC